MQRYSNLNKQDITLRLCIPDKKVYIINDMGGRTLELAWVDNTLVSHGDISYAYFVKGMSGLDKSIAYLETRGYQSV